MKHFYFTRAPFWLLVLLASLNTFAQTNVTLPTQCASCSVPCTPPTTPVCDAAAATISAGGTLTSSVTGGTGGSITWTIAPTAGVSTASGSGTTTGAVTFATAGTYTVTFTSTNNATPAACSPAISVTCTRTITVNAAPSGTLTAFNCAAATPSPATFTKNIAYTGTAPLSYTGGNGGTYAAGSVASTGITGFTATWAAGTLATGAGSITITITGTSTVDGTATFPITIAGQSCNITLSSCGAFVAAGVWKPFLCHNLGADINADPHTVTASSWNLQGAYVKWGVRGPNTPTGDSRLDWQTAANTSSFAAAPTASDPNSGTIAGWYDNATGPTPAPDYSWRTAGGAKTANDPCPPGYRVPTATEWQGVINNNTRSRTGSWVVGNTEYGSALHFGPNASTKLLTLPTAGYRNTTNGSLTFRGTYSWYYSSSEGASIRRSQIFYFDQTNAFINNDFERINGMPIRCIQE